MRRQAIQQFYALLAAGTTAPFVSGILDGLTGLYPCYGLRRMRGAYSGPLLKLRNGSNALLDIGFDSNGDLDTAAVTAHAGGGNVFVDTWYDQSTNAKNATQATASLQPQLLLSQINGKPALYFDGTRYLTVGTSTNSFPALHQGLGSLNVIFKVGASADPNALYSFMGNNGLSSSKTGVHIGYDDRASSSLSNAMRVQTAKGTGTAQTIVSDAVNNAITPQTWTIGTWLLDNGNATLALRSEQYVNNGAKLAQNNVSVNTPAAFVATHDMQIGATGANTFPLVGYLAEIITKSGKMTTDEKNAVLANQNTYYAVY